MPQLRKDQTAKLASLLALAAAQNDGPRPILIPCDDDLVAQAAFVALSAPPPNGFGLVCEARAGEGLALGTRDDGFTWGP
jgi:hypothetical protein